LGVQSLGLLFSTSDCLWRYHCQPLAFLQFLALTFILNLVNLSVIYFVHG